MTLEETWGQFRAALSLFIALEQEDNVTIRAIVDEYHEHDLLHGWDIVARRLRQDLEHHAQALGCDCGSLEWLERLRLDLAAAERGDDPDAACVQRGSAKAPAVS